MTKKSLGITAAVIGVLAVLCGVLFVYNVVHVAPQVVAMAANGPQAGPSKWDSFFTLLSGLFTGGLTLSGLVTTVLAIIKKGTEAAVDKVLPGASVDTKAKAVDVSTIASIQLALLTTKDAETRKGLINSGRAAFADLMERTFPLPVEVPA